LPLLLVAGNAVAAEGFIIGGGVERDSSDGLAGAVVADVGLTEKTWLSGTAAYNSVDVVFGRSLDTWYGDLGLDHWFDPVGVRVGVAYWGDSDVLDSNDLTGSLYVRTDKLMLSGDYEYRDFTFEIPATDFFQARTVSFDANGFGATARFDLTDNVDLSLSGMDYDYSINLRLSDNRRILELLSFSRLSLINSLVDYRAYATLGIDAGEQRWQFEIGTWKGEIDRGQTRSATIRFLTPMGDSSDIEFGLGFDDSDLYGDVTFLSVWAYFYGGT
jgi:hypothetical protein